MHKEHQTPSPEQLDKKVLAVLKAQRGLTLSMLLTVVRGATGKTLSESLKRLQATHRVTKAKLDGAVRYFRAGYMLGDSTSERGEARRREVESAAKTPPRTYTSGSQRAPWVPPPFMEPARAGATDFLSVPSKGVAL
jgi:hypothetical protein